jgi:pyridoxine 4-dehydrogenase
LVFLPWAPIHDIGGNTAIGQIAAKHEGTAIEVVLAWRLARSPVMMPIPGTGSVSHLEANVAAAALRLEPDEVASITYTIA